jgi:YVTN family beta-propeller protein
VVQVSGSKLSLVTRIKVTGNPNKMILDSAQTNLYVSEDNSDLVDVISTSTNQVLSSISVAGPKDAVGSSLVTYHGFAPNGLTLSPDGKTLYVTVGGTNSLAVADLTQTPSAVVGLVHTGYYPNDVSVSHDGKIVWEGLKGSAPYPTQRTGIDLRQNRQQLLLRTARVANAGS